jgi:plasmid replication initiation protein
MPKIAVYKFLTFYIFAFDALNEPPHLHVAKEKGKRQRSAKIWINTLEIAHKGSLNDADLKQALKIIKGHKQVLTDSFNRVKEGKKITTIKFVS